MPRYIDADVLLKRLQHQQTYGSIQDGKGRAKAILEVIHTPTADVELVRHGRWIEKDSRYVHNFKCSVCNDVRFDIPTCMGKPLFNFCPNCGAKMDLEDGDEDATNR